MSADLVRT